MGKKILIIGASSFIGSKIRTYFGNSLCTYKNNFLEKGIYFDATNTRIKDVLPKDAELTHALILSAVTKVDECKANLERSYQLNVTSTKQILEDLIKLNIKPIFFSSEYVFDGEKGNYKETNLPNPTTEYGKQKWEIEQFLHTHSDNYTILRLAKVIGTQPEDNTILSNWLKEIMAEKEIYCANDQIFSPISVEDVATITKVTIYKDLNGTFHTCGEKCISRLNLLEELTKHIKKKVKIIPCSLSELNFLDARPKNLSMSSEKILSATGLKLKTIEDCCQELIKNNELKNGKF